MFVGVFVWSNSSRCVAGLVPAMQWPVISSSSSSCSEEKASSNDRRLNLFFSLPVFCPSRWNLYPILSLPLEFANLGTRFCLRGVVLSHSKIFNFGLWVSFRMCSAIFRVFREFSKIFLKLFSFSCELISFFLNGSKIFFQEFQIFYLDSCIPYYLQQLLGNFRIFGIYFSRFNLK